MRKKHTFLVHDVFECVRVAREVHRAVAALSNFPDDGDVGCIVARNAGAVSRGSGRGAGSTLKQLLHHALHFQYVRVLSTHFRHEALHHSRGFDVDD